jgi:hypothetical protein
MRKPVTVAVGVEGAIDHLEWALYELDRANEDGARFAIREATTLLREEKDDRKKPSRRTLGEHLESAERLFRRLVEGGGAFDDGPAAKAPFILGVLRDYAEIEGDE